ncbi:hypothetical protein ACWNT8_07195 [Pigmentibacter ruber]|uniref:hypothetical protein n=1 Tax=Pigmentibacter ruber TaxID=2683196 RepID=UPI00131B088C|nr:hypothetical protein [Pigmentibacter ruber]BFD32947.1 hypothetical protein GTC16762_25650 [Pigmentibacter ruber]
MKSQNKNSFVFDNSDKAIPVIIGAQETQSFLNDVIKNSKEKNQNPNQIKKWWFWLGFLGGVFIASLGIFFTFTTVFFIQNSILDKPNFIYEKVICEKH